MEQITGPTGQPSGATGGYDPFVAGPHAVATHAFEAHDRVRDRVFPAQVWFPAGRRPADPRPADPRQAGPAPLVVYSHQGGGHRAVATFLCEHLSSHGYVVAALDHSETFAPELQPRPGETAEQRAARGQAWISNRVPDAQFLLDHVLTGVLAGHGVEPDPQRIAAVGHSFGGWTALALAEVDTRVQAVVAMAPAGTSRPKPGVVPATLDFDRVHPVATLYLAADEDVATQLDGIREMFDRTPGPKRMFVLHRAGHQHFVDDAEGTHEAWRTDPFPGEGAWMSAAMRPFAEMCPAAEAHTFARGLTLAHLDATLRTHVGAERLLAGDVVAALARRGVTASGTA